jgi:large subunit ribosomal protein L24
MAAKLKKGDVVVVIAGNDKRRSGSDIAEHSGAILAVDHGKSQVVVEGINVRQITKRRTAQDGAGGFDSRECPIHISNVMLKSRYDAKHG